MISTEHYCLVNRNENKKKETDQNILFSSTKNDFDLYYEEICQKIDDIRLFNIWFFQDASFMPDLNDIYYESLIKTIDLIVIPVSYELLTTENRTIDIDLNLARKFHIPILPIVEEGDINSLYESRFGKIQYLDKQQDIKTQIDFNNKLKKYINEVLLDKKTIEKIRQEFSNYIFLSYRKKDRALAQQLMKLVHSHDFMRDVAIWYDENLTPGENFEQRIAENLNKSNLFLLNVTPNLNEIPNYVLDYEYPAAIKNKKDILAVEMKETSKDVFLKNYSSINEIVRGTSEDIKDKLISIFKHEANCNPDHLYCIGLAYLNGVDVERDVEKGIALLNESANLNYIPALESLAKLYKDGKVVDVNYEMSLKYFNSIFEIKKSIKTKDDELSNALNDIALLLGEMGRYDESLNLHKVVLADRIKQHGKNNLLVMLSLKDIASVYMHMEKWDEALEIYLALCDKKITNFISENNVLALSMFDDMATALERLGHLDFALELREDVYNRLNTLYGSNNYDTLIALGNLANSYALHGKDEKALELNFIEYSKEREIFGDDHPMTLSTQSDIAYLLAKKKNFRKAKDIYLSVFTKRKKILGNNHPNTIKSAANLSFLLIKLTYYKSLINIMEDVVNSFQSTNITANLDVLRIYENLCLCYIKTNNKKRGFEYSKKTYELSKQLLGEENEETLTNLTNLIISLHHNKKYVKAMELAYEKISIFIHVFGSDDKTTRLIASLYIARAIKYKLIDAPSKIRKIINKIYAL